jgi:hypothetical protein
VKHGRFVALYRQEVSVSDIDRGVGPSTPIIDCSRRGHMDITVIHVNPIDSRVAGRLAMGLWWLVDNRASWSRLVS